MTIARGPLHVNLTGDQLHPAKFTRIAGAPNTVPSYIGQSVIDYEHNILYYANGASSVDDWQAIVGDGGANSVLTVNDATYTVTASNNNAVIRLTLNNTRTVTLAEAPINGFTVAIQDASSSGASTNAITVNRSGSDIFFGGGTSYTIDSDEASIVFVYDSSVSTWSVRSAYEGKDPRFDNVRNFSGSSLDITSSDSLNLNATTNLTTQINGADAFSCTTSNFNVNKNLVIHDPSVTTKTVTTSVSGATASTATNLIFSQTAARNITFPDTTGVLALQTGNVAANDSNTTFSNPDNRFQCVNPTADRVYTISSSLIKQGDKWSFFNRSNFTCFLHASDATGISHVRPNELVQCMSLKDNPITDTDWVVVSANGGYYDTTSALTYAGIFTVDTTIKYTVTYEKAYITIAGQISTPLPITPTVGASGLLFDSPLFYLSEGTPPFSYFFIQPQGALPSDFETNLEIDTASPTKPFFLTLSSSTPYSFNIINFSYSYARFH